MIKYVFIGFITIIAIPLVISIILLFFGKPKAVFFANIIIFSIVEILSVSAMYFICFYEIESPQKLDISQLEKIDFSEMLPRDFKNVFNDYNIDFYNEKYIPEVTYSSGDRIVMAQFSHKTESCTIFYNYSELSSRKSFDYALSLFSANKEEITIRKSKNINYYFTKIKRPVGDWGELMNSYNAEIYIQSGNVNIMIFTISNSKNEVTRRNNQIISDIVKNIKKVRQSD